MKIVFAIILAVCTGLAIGWLLTTGFPPCKQVEWIVSGDQVITSSNCFCKGKAERVGFIYKNYEGLWRASANRKLCSASFKDEDSAKKYVEDCLTKY